MAHRFGRCAPRALLLGAACPQPGFRAEHSCVSPVHGFGVDRPCKPWIHACPPRFRLEARRVVHRIRPVHSLYRHYVDRDSHVLVGDVFRHAVRAHRVAHRVRFARAGVRRLCGLRPETRAGEETSCGCAAFVVGCLRCVKPVQRIPSLLWRHVRLYGEPAAAHLLHQSSCPSTRRGGFGGARGERRHSGCALCAVAYGARASDGRCVEHVLGEHGVSRHLHRVRDVPGTDELRAFRVGGKLRRRAPGGGAGSSGGDARVALRMGRLVSRAPGEAACSCRRTCRRRLVHCDREGCGRRGLRGTGCRWLCRRRQLVFCEWVRRGR